MERPSSQAGRRGPRRSVAGYDHIEQTQALMSSIIHELVHACDVTALKEEFLRDKGLIETVNSEGMTPLFVAVSTGNLELVQYLATSGAFLDSKDNLGRTPLALAAYQGWNDGVYYLLALGASSTLVDNCGRLPLHAATYYSSGRTVELLLQRLPAEYVDKPDSEGMTALHWSAFHGRAEHIKLLIDHGAELVARDTEGKTPLHWAAQNGSVPCCQVILNTSAGQHLLNGRDFSGKTPIHYAAAAGHLDALQELLNEKFASVESLDNEHRIPLHWAAATGHVRCVAALLRAGSDKDSVDKHGATPIMYSHQGLHKLCCEIIIKHDPEHPLDTEVPDATVETVRVPTPPEIHIVSESPLDHKTTDPVLEPAISSNGTADSLTPRVRSLSRGQQASDAEKAQDRADDSEVQDIFKTSLGAVEVLVEMDGKSDTDSNTGRVSALLHDVFDNPSPISVLTPPSSPSFLSNKHAGMNGVHSDGDSTGYSSEDDARYPPQMVLTPIPVSPVPPEDGNNNFDEHPSKPPILPRFSFENNTQAPFLKPPSTASTLAPLKPRTVPEHLRLDLGYKPTTAKLFEAKPSSPATTTESGLGPLKIAKAKQHSPPAKQHSPVSTIPQAVTSPTTRSPLGSGMPSSREGSSSEKDRGFFREATDFTKFWARKGKKADPLKPKVSSGRLKFMNRSLSIPEESRSPATSSLRGAAGYSEIKQDRLDYRQFDSDSEWPRKLKEKQSPSGSIGGQMLPAISKDKSNNRVAQVQGSLRDQIEAKRKTKKKPSRFSRSYPRGLFGLGSMDDSTGSFDDDTRPLKSSEKKEKKKVRKVMSWNN